MSKHDVAVDKMERQILKASKRKELDVVYSAYDDDENDIPINNLSKVAIKGKAILYSDGWGEESYYSDIVTNPTFLDLALIADVAIRMTKDSHHVFFEGVRDTGRKKNGVRVFKLCMGS